MKNLENFPLVLRNYLRTNRIEQKEFAQKVGVSSQQVNRWANGTSNPTPKTIDLMVSSYPDLFSLDSANSQVQQAEPKTNQINTLYNELKKQLAEKQSIIDRLLNIIDNQSELLGKQKGNQTMPKEAVVRYLGLEPQLKVA